MDNLTHLNITRLDENETPTIPKPGFLEPLKNLRVLQAGSAKLQKLPQAFLCHLPELEYIDLSYNDASIANRLRSCDSNAQSTKALLPKVTFLNLNGNDITDVPILQLVVPNVEVLGLGSNKIPSLSNNTFNGLFNLQRLYLENNPIATLLRSAFRGLVNLQLLNLENANLAKLESDTFQDTLHLWLLTLANNRLDDRTFHNGEGSITNDIPNINFLDLSSNRISNISGLFSKMHSLIELSLEKNSIGEIPSRVFENQKILQSLTVSGNPLTEDDGLDNESFAGLQEIKTLISVTAC